MPRFAQSLTTFIWPTLCFISRYVESISHSEDSFIKNYSAFSLLFFKIRSKSAAVRCVTKEDNGLWQLNVAASSLLRDFCLGCCFRLFAMSLLVLLSTRESKKANPIRCSEKYQRWRWKAFAELIAIVRFGYSWIRWRSLASLNGARSANGASFQNCPYINATKRLMSVIPFFYFAVITNWSWNKYIFIQYIAFAIQRALCVAPGARNFTLNSDVVVDPPRKIRHKFKSSK